MFRYLTDFGFNTSTFYNKNAEPGHSQSQDYGEITFGSQNDSIKILWTTLVYLFLALGLFVRPLVVAFDDVSKGLNTQTFRWDILITALIIALAMLSPLLKIISKINKGKLSWQHCLTAFSIGFFSDLTFKLILDSFVGLLGINH